MAGARVNVQRNLILFAIYVAGYCIDPLIYKAFNPWLLDIVVERTISFRFSR